MRHLSRARSLAVCVALFALTSAYSLPSAQTPAKKALSIADYAKWRTIAGQDLSGDGKWATFTLQQMNTIPAEAKPVLHLRNLDTNDEVKVEHATGGTFSPDSKWIAYQVDPGAAERARRERAGSGGGAPGGGAPGT